MGVNVSRKNACAASLHNFLFMASKAVMAAQTAWSHRSQTEEVHRVYAFCAIVVSIYLVPCMSLCIPYIFQCVHVYSMSAALCIPRISFDASAPPVGPPAVVPAPAAPPWRPTWETEAAPTPACSKTEHTAQYQHRHNGATTSKPLWLRSKAPPLAGAQMSVDGSLLLDDWQLQVQHLAPEKVQTFPLLLKLLWPTLEAKTFGTDTVKHGSDRVLLNAENLISSDLTLPLFSCGGSRFLKCCRCTDNQTSW